MFPVSLPEVEEVDSPLVPLLFSPLVDSTELFDLGMIRYEYLSEGEPGGAFGSTTIVNGKSSILGSVSPWFDMIVKGWPVVSSGIGKIVKGYPLELVIEPVGFGVI